MFAETLAVVCCCSLLAASATAVAASTGFEPDAEAVRFPEGTNAQRFHTTAAATTTQRFHTTAAAAAAQRFRTTAASTAAAGSRPCCGPSSPSPSFAPAVVHRATTEGGGARYYQPQEIPLNFIKELNQVTNVTEFFTRFMPDTNLYKAQNLIAMTGLQSRVAPNVERRASSIPKPAICSVESQTINLKDTDDPSLYYYPPCTRVNRCGGCCVHDLLACQPTKTETLNFEVMVSQYNAVGKLEFIGKKPVSIVQHVKCKCDCIIQSSDCNELQTYYPDECRCVCNNEDDQEKCNEEHDIKLWNPATCSCQCREVQECTSGFGFNYNSCRCEALRVRIKNPGLEFKKNSYSIGGT